MLNTCVKGGNLGKILSLMEDTMQVKVQKLWNDKKQCISKMQINSILSKQYRALARQIMHLPECYIDRVEEIVQLWRSINSFYFTLMRDYIIFIYLILVYLISVSPYGSFPIYLQQWFTVYSESVFQHSVESHLFGVCIIMAKLGNNQFSRKSFIWCLYYHIKT